MSRRINTFPSPITFVNHHNVANLGHPQPPASSSMQTDASSCSPSSTLCRALPPLRPLLLVDRLCRRESGEYPQIHSTAVSTRDHAIQRVNDPIPPPLVTTDQGLAFLNPPMVASVCPRPESSACKVRTSNFTPRPSPAPVPTRTGLTTRADGPRATSPPNAMTRCTLTCPGPLAPLLTQLDALRCVCDPPVLACDPGHQASTNSPSSNTTSSSSWSIEYPRALNEASESSAVPLHTFPQPYSRSTTNLYTTNSRTLMDPIESNKILSPHPDVMHPPSLNQATVLSEDKLVSTLEDRFACI